jgi:hypothetical protein
MKEENARNIFNGLKGISMDGWDDEGEFLTYKRKNMRDATVQWSKHYKMGIVNATGQVFDSNEQPEVKHWFHDIEISKDRLTFIVKDGVRGDSRYHINIDQPIPGRVRGTL